MPDARRVVVLEADTINRFSTERILRREDYWVFVTEDAAAAARVASVSAIDLVLVDLGLGRLEAVPQWQRRRGDAAFRGVPPSLTDGYAVLRPLHVDPASARFPVVTLRMDERPSEPPPPCRFAVVEFLPRPWKAGGLVEGLDAVFRHVAPADGTPSRRRRPRGRSTRRRARERAARPDATAARSRARPSRCAPRSSWTRTTPSAARSSEDLVRHGFSVLEATTGAEALRLAVARRPWLVLTELTFPTRAASPCAGGCAATASCGARRSSSSPRGTTATPATRP